MEVLQGPHKLWLKRATIDYESFFKGGRHVEPFVNGLWSYQNPFYPFTTLTLMLVVVCSWMEMMDHSISLLRRSALVFVKIWIFSIRVKFLHKVESLIFLKVESVLHFKSSPPSLHFKLKSSH
ncbi:hypothetical protein V1478_012391, partial [Vespula squamosa]